MLSLVGPTLQLHHTSELGLFVRAVFDRFPAIAIATSVKRELSLDLLLSMPFSSSSSAARMILEARIC